MSCCSGVPPTARPPVHLPACLSPSTLPASPQDAVNRVLALEQMGECFLPMREGCPGQVGVGGMLLSCCQPVELPSTGCCRDLGGF